MERNTAVKTEAGPWEALENGATAWENFTPSQQERIVRHYAPKIRFLALRMKARLPRSVELGELISAGTLGLMEALGKFQPRRGIRFETYAESRIRGAMLDELRRLDWFPRSLRQRVRALDETMRAIEHEKGRPANEDELCQATGFSRAEVREGLEALQSQFWVSLDSIQESVGADTPGQGAPYATYAMRDVALRVARLLDALTQREKMVLSLYYDEELTMRETAAVMGITEGRVSQLHSQALARLRRSYLARYGETAEF